VSPWELILMRNRSLNSSRAGGFFGDVDRTYAERSVNGFTSGTRIIIHWNAATGMVNYENGPPIDHPRLMALLCDATLECSTLTTPVSRLG
jgi:hypothetical protein